MRFDKEKFLFLYQNEYKPLNDSQKAGLLAILEQIENDTHVTDIRWAAYMLATVKRECGGEWQPIGEYDKGKGRKYGVPAGPYGHIYYGRGLTQNTWLDNYRMLTEAWNKAHPDRPVDFVKDPDLLLQIEYSYWAMSYAMRNGAYTGVGLKKYINAEKCDYLNSRRIINGTDCADMIAGYATTIEKLLTLSEMAA